MADYLTELKHALEAAAAREYPVPEARSSVLLALRWRIVRAMAPRTRAALARVSVVLALGVVGVVFVVAVGLLHHGRAQHGTGRATAQHAPHAVHQRPNPGRAEHAIDSALARGIDPPAPDQRLPLPILGATGTLTLKDFRGHVVVLNVFAAWCQPCKAESATLETTQRKIEKEGGTVLGVSYLSDVAPTERFVRAQHITYQVLRDATRRLAVALGVLGVPETFVIDRDGRIVAARRYEIAGRWLTHALARARRAGAK